MLSKLLNIPEGADPIETLSALSKLKLEAETLQAACAAKEAELAELRAQTAELFGSSLEEAGHDEEAVTAAKAAWLRDPATAAQAIAGCSIEEAVSAAGCNQYKHKPDCPEARNETGTPQKENLDVYYLYNNKDGKMEEVAEEEMFDFIDEGLTTATITSDEKGLTIEAGEDKRTLKFGKGKNERAKQREFVARAFGSFDYEIDGKPALDDDALDKVLDMAKKYKSVSLAVFGDYVESSHEPSIEDLLVGDLVQAAGCNQYKHKPGCPEAEGGAETDYEAEIEKTRKKLESANEDKHKKQKVLNGLVEEKEMYNRWAFEKQREGWSLEKINEDFNRQMGKVMPKIEKAEKEFKDAVKEWESIGYDLSRLEYEAKKRKKDS